MQRKFKWWKIILSFLPVCLSLPVCLPASMCLHVFLRLCVCLCLKISCTFPDIPTPRWHSARFHHILGYLMVCPRETQGASRCRKIWFLFFCFDQFTCLRFYGNGCCVSGDAEPSQHDVAVSMDSISLPPPVSFSHSLSKVCLFFVEHFFVHPSFRHPMFVSPYILIAVCISVFFFSPHSFSILSFIATFLSIFPLASTLPNCLF